MLQNDEIQRILPVLKSGGIFLYPTDTVWGIGCDPFQKKALERVKILKQTPPTEAFVLLVKDQLMLNEYVEKIDPKIQAMLDYHTRPVTVIYDEVKNLPDFLLAPDGSIAIRITQDDFCKNLLQAFGKPILSTTPNLYGQPIASKFSQIGEPIKAAMDYIVRYRQREQEETEVSVIVRLIERGELDFLRL